MSSLTLELHMDSLFRHGLQLMRDNEQHIRNEWDLLKEYFQESGKKSTLITEKSIAVLTKTLFDSSDYSSDQLLNELKKTWSAEIGDNDLTQFILTLLESSIHRSMKLHTTYNHKDYQSIQYVFSTMNEQLYSKMEKDAFSIDTFLEHLVSSKQNPIESVALVVHENNLMVINAWYCKRKGNKEKNPLLVADSLYELMELFLQHENHSDAKNVLPISFEDITLLVCTKKDNASQVIPFITYALQLYKTGKATLKLTRQKLQWKDSVIMFNESVIQARTYNDAVDIITEGFVNYLPFERCALFSYSSNDQIGFGISGHRHDNKEIREITENISNFPLIHKGLDLLRLFGNGIKYLQPLYIADARDSFPKQYIKQFQLKSLVVAPIFNPYSNMLIGAAILDQGANESFSISQETYTALIKFGQIAGEVLGKFHTNLDAFNEIPRLSPREIEVLKLMAEGESTTSAASILHLSEYTVRDYITTLMQKLNAKNRTEAVARAIRKGII